jgi:hypothetical protein
VLKRHKLAQKVIKNTPLDKPLEALTSSLTDMHELVKVTRTGRH